MIYALLLAVALFTSTVVSTVGGYLVYRRVREVRETRENYDPDTPQGELVETESGDLLWKAPEDPRTKGVASTLKADGSGNTLSGTWTEFSGEETNLTRTSDDEERGETPRGFRGEDLSDEEVREWLREHGLHGYE